MLLSPLILLLLLLLLPSAAASLEGVHVMLSAHAISTPCPPLRHTHARAHISLELGQVSCGATTYINVAITTTSITVITITTTTT